MTSNFANAARGQMMGDRTRPAKPQRPKRRRRRYWYSIFLLILTVGTLGAATAVGVLTGYLNSLPPIERLENYSPPQVSHLIDREGIEQIGQFSEERRQVVTIDQIPRRLRDAFLSIEDDRFYSHYGVDLKAILRSIVANRREGRSAQGGSTITMQLPRNILDVGREKRIERKIKEALLAFQIERRYSKDQILEFYLNHIFLGYQSFGVKAAAETYFSKDLDELTLAECATLAAIPKGPSIYNPIAAPERCLRRRDYIIGRMATLEWITEAQRDEARAEPLEVRRRRAGSNVANSQFPYFVDALSRNLREKHDITRTELRTKGFHIRTTIDTRMQTVAEEELRRQLVEAEKLWQSRKRERFWKEAEEFPGAPRAGQSRLFEITARTEAGIEVDLEGYTATIELAEELPYYSPEEILAEGNLIDVRIQDIDYSKRKVTGVLADTSRLQGSVVILDVATGDVLALVGGADFHDRRGSGQFNRAIMGGKPAGSTVKPFFYAAALESGVAPHDQIYDEPIIYPSTPVDYRPRNYEKTFFGPTTILEALQHSRNIVTIRLLEHVGIRKSIEQVRRFDSFISSKRWADKLRPELSVCLGPIDLNTLELAAAYQAFANQGILRQPRFFQAVEDGEGRTLVAPKPSESIVMDPIVAYQMVYMLRQAVVGGTGRSQIGNKFSTPPYPPICGKTGTTDNTTDAWFVGFTPDIVMVCYVGYDTPRSMGPRMTGSRVAGPMWANIFRRIIPLREDWKMRFEKPTGIEFINICGYTGKIESDVCDRWDHDVFAAVPYRKGTGPLEACDGEPREPIIARASYTEGWAKPWRGGDAKGDDTPFGFGR